MPIFKIIASQIGNDAGPFTITNNLGQVIATGITRLQLLNGYSFNVPTGITSVTATSTGNCTNSVTLPIPNEGYWEMEKANIEQVSDHYGIIADNYVVPVETFVALDVVGVYKGVVSGTGTWLIKGSSEDIVGTTYNGGGTLILTANNTPTATTIQTGSIVQLGYDLNATSGAIGNGLTTVQSGAQLNIVGADAPTGRAVFADLANYGTVNITGNDVCGEGYFRNVGTFDNRSLVKIDDAKFTFNNPTTFSANTGTIQVLDGATLSTSVAIPATQTLQLNGCGKCSPTGKQEGALLHNVSATLTIASPIIIESETCIKGAGAGTVTFSGVLSGSDTLTLGNATDSTSKYGSTTFSNNASTFTGDLIIKNTTLLDGNSLTFQNSNVTLVGDAFIQSTTTKTFKSLASDSPNSSLTTWSVPVILTDNGITTYAGLFNNSQGLVGSALTIDGVGNEINLTNSATNNYGFRVLDGAKMSFSGGQIVGDITAQNGGKITFGKTTTGGVNPRALTMTNNAVIEVQAIDATTPGRFVTYGQFNVTGGYKIDLVDNLNAGTYTIMTASGGGTGVGQIPTIGINNTGKTPTFSWVGNILKVTLV